MNSKLKTGGTRRDFLKTTSALAAMGITTSLTPQLLFAQSKTDLKGVSIDYYAMAHGQNPIARGITESIIKAFEQRTGATVNTTWGGYGDILNPKLRTMFKAGEKPTVLESMARWTGDLRPFFRPLNDFIDNDLDAEIRDNIAWMFPVIRQQNSGAPDADAIKDLPFTFFAQSPVLTRRDHWEKAGLDFDKEWPIRDSDHFIQICQELKDKKVSKYPTEVYGTQWDGFDVHLPGWIRSLDPSKGAMINEDWTRSNADSPSWTEGFQYYVDLFRKYKFSSPASVKSTDEKAVELFIQGRKSIVHNDAFNRGTLLAKIPELVKDGTVQWAPNFPLKGGDPDRVAFSMNMSLSMVEQEGPDAEIKEKAGWEFIKEWYREDNQIALSNGLSPCARADLWESQMSAPDGYMKANAAMAKHMAAWTNHPRSAQIQYHMLAPVFADVLQGGDVATALKGYAAEVNKLLAG
tara:strand:+ start:6166 stop:7554 length:1389 start_codon:yes stop_codon:yes gene_type:complete